jgi:hypothetical protein
LFSQVAVFVIINFETVDWVDTCRTYSPNSIDVLAFLIKINRNNSVKLCCCISLILFLFLDANPYC